MLRSISNIPGNPCSQTWEEKEGYSGIDLQKRNVLSMEWKSEGWWNTNTKYEC